MSRIAWTCPQCGNVNARWAKVCGKCEWKEPDPVAPMPEPEVAPMTEEEAEVHASFARLEELDRRNFEPNPWRSRYLCLNAAYRQERERAERAEGERSRASLGAVVALERIENLEARLDRADKLAEAVARALKDVGWAIGKPQNINGVFSSDAMSEEHYRLTTDAMSKLDDVSMDLFEALSAYRAGGGEVK